MNEPEAGGDYTDQDFSGLKLAQADLTDASFRQCTFEATDLHRANLSGCEFIQCEFNNASSDAPAILSHARLREARFERCNLTVVALHGCQGYGAEFIRCQMQGTDLSQGDFRLPVGDSDLVELTIVDSNLSFANLSNNYLLGLSGSRPRNGKFLKSFFDVFILI